MINVEMKSFCLTLYYIVYLRFIRAIDRCILDVTM